MTTFHFRQFSVLQQRSAMKVCTDATLFGAMAPIKGGEGVLDIGTGTGLLALMAAQLGAATVTAVELTAEAFTEAEFNFSRSPWSRVLTAVHRDIQSYATVCQHRYDLIISNPPFFEGHSKAGESLRNMARHADLLPYSDLIEAIESLLQDDGLFYLLMPLHAVAGFVEQAAASGLSLAKQVDIRGYSHNRAKVSALTFSRKQTPLQTRLLTIYREQNVYSPESEAYLREFLVRFAK